MKFSILDVCPIRAGEGFNDAVAAAVDRAYFAESLGFHRYWVAEHHLLPGIASCAPAVLIAAIAGATTRLRVGAGGVMLPFHPPLIVAEQFATLNALYPGRVDLGLGRSLPTPEAASALRYDSRRRAAFANDVSELLMQLQRFQGSECIEPVILGTSITSAQLCAALGLPFAFAAHFEADELEPAVEAYRAEFRPRRPDGAPHVLVAINVFAGVTDEDALTAASSMVLAGLEAFRGEGGALPEPRRAAPAWCMDNRAALDYLAARSLIGCEQTLNHQLKDLVRRSQPDEILVSGEIWDEQAKRYSLSLISKIIGEVPYA